MIAVAQLELTPLVFCSMHSAGRSKNFWIPPENGNESAVPSPISPAEPATPTRATSSANRPFQSASNLHSLGQQSSSHASQSYFSRTQLPTRPTGRTGHEFNRRERKFESLFNAWTEEMARLNEEHRTVTENVLSEADSKKAMDDFNAKAQYVIARYNEEIEALQMSSSEPGSSQDENDEDDEVDEEEEEIRPSSRALPAFMNRNGHVDTTGDGEDEDEEGTESEEVESEDEEPQVPETAIDDEEEEEDESETDEENSVRNSEHSSRRVAGSTSGTDDSDHSARLSRRSGKSYQSSEISNGSRGAKTPPPTEEDEDWRAAQRRRAREKRTADEVASSLPLRLRSGTLRGSSSPMSSVHRPPAMHLFETLSSSPASISSMHSSLVNSRRPSRDVPTTRPSPIELDPSQMSSRIEYLRRQNSTSGSDRSLSRNRQHSPVDHVKLFKDQFEGWKNAARSWSDEVRKQAQEQTEESRLRFEREQEEKHRRAQQLFIANQEKMFQQISRNRAGSTGASGQPNAPAGPHVRNNSFAIPSSAIPSSASPTAQRGTMAPPPLSSTPTNRPLQHATSQTFQLASSQSPARPRFQGQNHQSSPIADNRHSTASSSGSDEVEIAVDDDEFDASTPHNQKGTPPISIPNSTRGSFDAGHRRMNSQIYTGPSGQRNNFPQQLRNSSSTTFSSTSGTQSARSSGGWSGVSGASSNTTVTTSDTPSSRRGSMGEKTFVQPVGLHNDHRKAAATSGVANASPPTQGHRWMQGSLDASGSSSHNSGSGLSRAATLPIGFNPSPVPGSAIPPRTTAQQWTSIASSSSPSAASSVQPGTSVGSSNSGMASRPPPVSLNIGHQSPSKTSWKMAGQPSPPIPIATRPSSVSVSILGSQRMRPETNAINGPTGSSPPAPLAIAADRARINKSIRVACKAYFYPSQVINLSSQGHFV
ncbi:hypothetical protein FRB91_009149 [Serendipita sp. 411]|nr:hypothetical protein FRB91_009149 [Serendipita sp. 411]